MEENQKLALHQIRSFSDIIGDTITLIKQGIRPLGKGLLFSIGPLLIIMAIISGLINAQMMGNLQTSMFNYSQQNPFGTIATFGIGYLLIILLSIIITVLMQLYSYEYIKLYNEKDFTSITSKDIGSAVRKNFWKLLWTNIGMVILLVVGAGIVAIPVALISAFFSSIAGAVIIPIMIFVLILAMFYFLLAFAFVPVSRIIEDTGFFRSIKRSIYLMFGNWWSTFGLMFILMIILSVLGFVFALPYYGLFTWITFHNLNNSGEIIPYLKPLTIAAQAFMMLTYFLYVIPLISIGLKFFTVVEKKEGAGLMEKIEELESDESK